MLLFASPKAQSTFSAGDIVEHVEQVGDVEADVERVARIADFELFLGFFLLVVGAEDAQAVRSSASSARPGTSRSTGSRRAAAPAAAAARRSRNAS